MHFCIMTESHKRLDEFIKSEKLISENNQLLVTVSGGMDSMFLLNYLMSRNYPIIVAHCNFGLRGDESNGDEKFVKAFCESHHIKFFTKQFETEKFAEENGISIQMAARDLRYQWFEELSISQSCHKIVTAHHKTDQVETILLNMVRGTGLKGLEGIPVISGKKIRPLLCLSRHEIEEDIKALNLTFREDSSNSIDKYHRNRIRHHVLPELKLINPAFEEIFQSNGLIISQANSFINHFMEGIKKEILKSGEQEMSLSINGLLKFPEPKFILYTLLADYGFNASTVKAIYEACRGISGKTFFSETHRITKHGDELIIQIIPKSMFMEFLINTETSSIITPHHQWKFEVSDDKTISGNKNEAVLDYQKLNFPLIVRVWKQGDKIKPLGMKGHKKVSDILIDHKISVPEKERTWVLDSASGLLWIQALTMDDDYKVLPSTNKVYRIRTEPVDL